MNCRSFIRYCQIFSVTLIFLFFLLGGIELHGSIGSQWESRECLVLDRKIVDSIGCNEGSYGGGGPCYSPWWNISSLDRNNITINNPIPGSSSYTDLKKARIALNKYEIGLTYPCYLQVGTNRFVPMYVWSLNSYLDVRIHLITGGVLISIGFILITFIATSCAILHKKENEDEEIPLTV